MTTNERYQQSQRFHDSVCMERALWEYYGIDKRPAGAASAFRNMRYFKSECRKMLRKIRKRVNETVTNDELLLEMLAQDVDGLDGEFKTLSTSKQNEIDIIGQFFVMIAHLLGWAYLEGKYFRTPIYYQTEQQIEESLQKGECLKTPCDVAYYKRKAVLQMRSEGVSRKQIAFILKVTEANVKSLEDAEHLDEWRERYLRERSR